MTAMEMVLTGLAVLALVIALVAVHDGRRLTNLTKTNADLRADLAASNKQKDRIAEDNARMRAQRQMPPPPTRAMPRDPDATWQMPAHQPPPTVRIDRTAT